MTEDVIDHVKYEAKKRQNPAESFVLESKVVEQKLDDSMDSRMMSGGTGEGAHHSSDECSDDEERKFMGTEVTYFKRTEVEMPAQEEETKGGNFDIRFTMSGPAMPYNANKSSKSSGMPTSHQS